MNQLCVYLLCSTYFDAVNIKLSLVKHTYSTTGNGLMSSKPQCSKSLMFRVTTA